MRCDVTNAGENRLVAVGSGTAGDDEEELMTDIPFPETQNYVKRILGTAEDLSHCIGEEGLRVSRQPRPAKATSAKADDEGVSREGDEKAAREEERMPVRKRKRPVNASPTFALRTTVGKRAASHLPTETSPPRTVHTIRPTPGHEVRAYGCTAARNIFM